MIKTALGIVNEGGAHKLWQGITPALYRHVFYSGIRIVTYESIRDNILRNELDGSVPIWLVFVLISMIYLMFSSFVCLNSDF